MSKYVIAIILCLSTVVMADTPTPTPTATSTPTATATATPTPTPSASPLLFGQVPRGTDMSLYAGWHIVNGKLVVSAVATPTPTPTP